MFCPKCEGALELREGEGHIGFTCTGCKGMWLPDKFLSSLQHYYEFSPADFSAALETGNPKPTHHPCPTCTKPLNVSTLEAIDLEWCRSCGGIWFDQNELSTLITRYREPGKGEAVKSIAEELLIALGTALGN